MKLKDITIAKKIEIQIRKKIVDDPKKGKNEKIKKGV